MRTLTLDLATNLGWAIGSTREGLTGHGVRALPETGEDIGAFLSAFRDWLGEAIEALNPGEIVFEAPILLKLTNITTLRKLYSLAGVTEIVARDYKIPVLEANLNDIRGHFIGSARAPKDIKGKEARRSWLKAKVIAECRRRGFRVADDNDADAIALLSYRLTSRANGFVLNAETGKPVAA